MKRKLVGEGNKLLVIGFPIDPMHVMFILNEENGEPTNICFALTTTQRIKVTKMYLHNYKVVKFFRGNGRALVS
jgi:hypothetical protein